MRPRPDQRVEDWRVNRGPMASDPGEQYGMFDIPSP